MPTSLQNRGAPGPGSSMLRGLVSPKVRRPPDSSPLRDRNSGTRKVATGCHNTQDLAAPKLVTLRWAEFPAELGAQQGWSFPPGERSGMAYETSESDIPQTWRTHMCASHLYQLKENMLIWAVNAVVSTKLAINNELQLRNPC